MSAVITGPGRYLTSDHQIVEIDSLMKGHTDVWWGEDSLGISRVWRSSGAHDSDGDHSLDIIARIPDRTALSSMCEAPAFDDRSDLRRQELVLLTSGAFNACKPGGDAQSTADHAVAMAVRALRKIEEIA